MAADGREGQLPTPAVFGDFWRQAAQLSSPPPYPDPSAGTQQVRHLRVAGLRAVTVMRWYIGDITAAGTGFRDGLWAAAIARAQTATSRVVGALGQQTAAPPRFPGGSFAARLDGYAAALTYGRDLLHTHLATTAYGGRRALSDWAPVVSSAPVSRALLAGLADHARAIAGQLAALSLDGAADPGTVAAWQRLQLAAELLRDLDAAVQAAQWQAPVLAEHRQLLEAIPVNAATPVTQVPPPQAPVSALCAGIISTAQRANQARRELAARAGWAPELTADSMRHAAASLVVTSLNTETVYRGLASRARQLGWHALVPGLDAAADHAVGSRRAWLAVARVWDTMVTDTRDYLSRPAAETGQLALWTGRLAYADPAWKPARGPSSEVRDAAGLAPGAAAFTEIASALHYTADCLVRAAHTDLDTVRTAAAGGRLYVTTRSLPAQFDVPRPYADAPPGRIAAALDAYADAASTCQAVLDMAAGVAAAVGAPSRVLTAAEHATAYLAVAPRGRLEQNLIDLGVHDAGLLRRGAELDQMAQRILAQAYRSGLVSPQPAPEAAREPDAADAAAEAARPAAATALELGTHEPPAGPSLMASRRAGQAGHTSAGAEAGASLDAPEIGDEEPELEL